MQYFPTKPKPLVLVEIPQCQQELNDQKFVLNISEDTVIGNPQ